jgi:hypothetical protein
MADQYQDSSPSIDSGPQLRDMEEKLRLLKDRILLIGQSLVDERGKNFNEIQELKKEFFKIKEENQRMKEFLQRVTEQLSNSARKEEVLILQRQFDLFRKE